MLNYFGVNLVILSFSTIKKILYSKNTVEFSSVKKVSVKKIGFPLILHIMCNFLLHKYILNYRIDTNFVK